jgi:hypothetical protein
MTNNVIPGWVILFMILLWPAKALHCVWNRENRSMDPGALVKGFPPRVRSERQERRVEERKKRSPVEKENKVNG